MSEVLDMEQTEQRPERAVAIRRFDTEITAEGRTLSFRIAPFGERATCADGLGGVPKGVPYQEELMPGLYDRQLRAANRVLLNFEHQQGIAGIVGHGLALRQERDGYHADFRVHETPEGEKTLLLAKEGVLGAASVESFWLKSIRAANGVVQRVKAHLEAVAICREGAYPSALLTGIRAEELLEEELILDEALLPVALDTETLERAHRLGIKLPEGMELALRAFTEASWDGSASRWDTPAAYCSACAIDLNPAGQPKTKDRCHLPYKEPGGDINVNALHAALSRLGQGLPQDATQAQRESARRMLERMLAEFNGRRSERKAHLVADTPVEADTSEDDTRQSQSTSTSEE